MYYFEDDYNANDNKTETNYNRSTQTNLRQDRICIMGLIEVR